MRTILLPALLASIHAASLSPCGAKAYFEITEDGGTNFAAVVRVPRWQEGAKVQLVWGANAVSVRDESVSKSVKLTEQSSAAQSFKLDKLHGGKDMASEMPPGSFTFRADGLPSTPELRCDLQALAAYPPSPPPPPPNCYASFIWKNGRRWTGGFEATLDVGGAGVPEGWVVARLSSRWAPARHRLRSMVSNRAPRTHSR